MVNHVRTADDPDVNDVAASFQEAVVETLLAKAADAVTQHRAKSLALAGGVAANSRLREAALDVAEDLAVTAYLPSREYCTDNAAMIAATGWWRLQSDGPSPLSTGADPSARIF